MLMLALNWRRKGLQITSLFKIPPLRWLLQSQRTNTHNAVTISYHTHESTVDHKC
jgi:hypothetical protein